MTTNWRIIVLLPDCGEGRAQSIARSEIARDRIADTVADSGAADVTRFESKVFEGGSVAFAESHSFALPSEKVATLRTWLSRQAFEFDVLLHPAVSDGDFKLVVFDLDSTLVTCEGIDELAALMGMRDQVSAITASAMRGEIDFAQSFRKRIALLKGLEESRVNEFVSRIELTPGAALTIRTLRKFGYRLAIATGGFDIVAGRLQRELGIDAFRANHLDCAGGKVTGEVSGQIVDAQGKADFLLQLAKEHAISPQQVIAVGDGANDIPMMQAAGLSVAYHAKPKVKDVADVALSHVGLDGLLYILGSHLKS